MNQYTSRCIAKHSSNHARVLEVETPHGNLTTPCFMPVGTRAVVNYMTPEQLADANSQIILGGNTYHMLVNPGMEVIKNTGGMHRFMNWDKPMLTDSGGYQVFSLSKNSKICKIKEDGAHFKHPISGKVIDLTAKTSIETQKIIGADIIMAFDQCTPEGDDRSLIRLAMDRTYRWLMESKATHDKNPNSAYGYRQAFFPIIQGGFEKDLRMECLEYVLKTEPDGIGIGGAVIGYDMPKTCEILDWLYPHLPEDKVHYTMGVGLEPQNLIDAVAHGADIFDCVAPTRNARHGALYCGKIVEENNWIRFAPLDEQERNRILIKKSQYKLDTDPIMPDCDCYTCQNYGRDYLHFLFKTNPSAFINLACIHNVHVMQMVCDKMRELIC